MRSTARTAGSRQQAEDASLPPAVRRNGWLAMRAAAHTRRAASSLSVSHGREGADRGPHHELRVPRPPHEGGQVEWPQAVKAGWRTGHIPNPLGRRAPRRCGRARAAAHARQRHARGRGRAGRLLRRGHRGALPRKPFRHCRAAAAAAAGIATGASAVARRAGQGLAQQRRVSDAREAGGAPGIERPKQLPGRGLTARRSRSGRAARDSRELRGASCLPRAP